AWLFGGTGNDVLNAAHKNSVLVGGDGNDNLQGGSGSEWLIGGRGSDILNGAAKSDLLVAGPSDYEVPTLANFQAIAAIMAEWTSSNSYLDRIHHLDGSKLGGLNGSYLINGSTVHDDTAVDTLSGGGDSDWFLANLTGGTLDVLKDRKSGEVATDLT